MVRFSVTSKRLTSTVAVDGVGGKPGGVVHPHVETLGAATAPRLGLGAGVCGGDSVEVTPEQGEHVDVVDRSQQVEHRQVRRQLGLHVGVQQLLSGRAHPPQVVDRLAGLVPYEVVFVGAPRDPQGDLDEAVLQRDR